MSEPLDLYNLKALEARATPGPWKGVRPDHSAWFIEQDGKPWRETHHVLTATKCPSCKDLTKGTCGVPSEEDAVFIVAARNAFPALIAAAEERDRLRSQVNELEELVLLQHNTYGSRDRILAEIEKMDESEDRRYDQRTPGFWLATARRLASEAAMHGLIG